MTNATTTKGALRSKAVWGAILTLVGAFGLLPFGASFNPDTGDLTVNVYTLTAGLAGLTTGGGWLLTLIGRVFARKTIVGLF